MSITAPEHAMHASEAWDFCERETVAAMGAINLAVAKLVETIVLLLASEGWGGHGIRSPQHWVMWKAGVSRGRAEGLVRIARRRDELPACWALFQEGRLTEDAMVRIAQRVPACRDAEVAAIAPGLLVSQLARVLSVLPEQPDPDNPRPKDPPDRFVRIYTGPDGSGRGEWSLPADEQALVMAALTAARDAELRDRKDLPADQAVTDGQAWSVTWADALVRLASEGADGLDATFRRTGHRGERNQVVLHQHVDAEGRFGPARLHLGAFPDRDVARYLSCEAQVIVLAWQDGKLLGINPAERTPNRRLRRALEHRDGGCAHPLCVQKLWLHAHHLQHWEDGGLTVARNLVMLCPRHHRELHMGAFTIEGDPEDGTLVFRTSRGERIEPPRAGAEPLPPPPPDQLRYRPPYGETLRAVDFSWN